VLALVEARRLEAVQADPARAASFLRQAEDRLNQLPLLTNLVVRSGIAYDACHDTGEALLAAYGFLTSNGPGQDEALGRYLRAVFDKPPAEGAAREFDRLRRALNQDATRRSRWVPRRPRRLSRSPGRCSTPPSPEGSRRDPGPQIDRKKFGRDRRSPTTSNSHANAFPQVRRRLSVSVGDDPRPPKPRVILPLQRLSKAGMSVTRPRGGASLVLSE
jgi:hypothetical protein